MVGKEAFTNLSANLRLNNVVNKHQPHCGYPDEKHELVEGRVATQHLPELMVHYQSEAD